MNEKDAGIVFSKTNQPENNTRIKPYLLSQTRPQQKMSALQGRE
jgi:hypothetical protein